MKVLLVDDERAFLLGMKNILQKRKILIDTAETYEHAMALLKNYSYNIVVTDIHLTRTTQEEGLEILRYIKEHTPDSKGIVITGCGDPAVLAKAFSLGASYCFEKPFPLLELQNALKNLSEIMKRLKQKKCKKYLKET